MREILTKLHIDTMREIFTPAEQAQITIITKRNMLELAGPEALTLRLSEAVNIKLKAPRNDT